MLRCSLNGAKDVADRSDIDLKDEANNVPRHAGSLAVAATKAATCLVAGGYVALAGRVMGSNVLPDWQTAKQAAVGNLRFTGEAESRQTR